MNITRISLISSINSNLFTQSKKIDQTNQSVNSQSIPFSYYPVFKGTTNYIAGLKDYTPEEYNKLSPDYIDKLRKEYEETMYADPEEEAENKLTEEIHDVASDIIIDSLNDEYGEDNWVVISLGRSPASIVNVIGYKVGADKAKHLPMTRATRFAGKNSVEALENTKELSDLKDYLSSIGLGVDEVTESNKHYVLVDYCASGMSLFGGYNLLNSELLYNDNPRVHSRSLVSLIPADNPQNFILEDAFHFGKFKFYSGIKKCYSLSDTKDSFCKPEEVSLKDNLMRFRLLDNAMKARSN